MMLAEIDQQNNQSYFEISESPFPNKEISLHLDNVDDQDDNLTYETRFEKKKNNCTFASKSYVNKGESQKKDLESDWKKILQPQKPRF